MTSPNDLSIEDRLRAHFADRARTMQIPGPEADTMLARAREGVPLEHGHGDDLARRRRRRRPGPLLAAAAVVAVIAVVAAVAVARGDDTADVSTDPRPPAPTPTTEPAPPATTEAPTTTTSAPFAPASIRTGPIVGGEGILGSWDGSSWVRWDGVESSVPAQAEYQVVGLDGAARPVTGTTRRWICTANEALTVDVGLEAADALAPLGIAVAGAGDLLPRPVELLDPSEPTYQEAARTMGEQLGATASDPTVGQVIRTDLDGDGTAEVLVAAYRAREPQTLMGEPGDWSGLLLRRVDGGDLQTAVVDSYVVAPEYTPYLEVSVVGAVADLNGDGRMEVVVNQRYYEGSSTSVYEYGADGTLREVLSVGCGV